MANPSSDIHGDVREEFGSSTEKIVRDSAPPAGGGPLMTGTERMAPLKSSDRRKKEESSLVRL